MGDLAIEKKPMADEQSQPIGLPNGLANGTSDHKEHRDHHKSKDRDKDRDRDKSKDRHHDKDRHKSSHKDKDKDKDKERSKDKDRHSSSHKSSHKDKDKDREREKNRDKDKERSRDKDKEHREKSDKDRSDKDRSRDDKHKDRSDKEKRDKDKERSDRHKDKDKDKDKDKSRDKDRDRHRDDKDKKSSSSSSSKKDKDRHHSSHKSSHRDKDKDKHRDRDKHHSEKPKVEIKEEIKEETPEETPEVNEVVNTEVEDVNTEVEDDPVVMKEEPVDEPDFASPSLDDSQVSYDSHMIKEDSEDDSKLVIKEEVPEEIDDEEEDDDIPLSARKRPKLEYDEDGDEDKPLISRKKIKSKKRKKVIEDEDDDFKPVKKKAKKTKKPKTEPSSSPMKEKRKKDKEEEQNVWKWWEEEKREDGKKWTFLEHKGPVLADPYDPLPNHIKFYYDGSHMVLSEGAEEPAGFYAKMLEHDYTTKEMFNKNFFKDWRKTMTEKEKSKITDLQKCDFRRIHEFYVMKNEERKNRSKEEKKVLKVKNEATVAEYGWCIIDGHKQRIGNFKIEPPGLFRGRGEHPKQGMLKKRTMPEDVIINCSKDSQYPKPPAGHRWKEVRADQSVTWLACWNENIQGSTKYVMLNAASKLKGEKDWQKYETARRLHKQVDKIRESYRADWKSKEMRIRQRGVALYFIDKLALRAGNEKDEDQADTVGCCSLRFEHLQLFEKKDGKEFVVVFDFLGKDSIRYYNEVPVEKRVFKNLQLFMENKQEGDDIFDRLNTQILNKYLNELLEGLTAKVFRTYNASRTLQEQLEKMTHPDDPIAAQILSYNRANREVAILCNHQRAVPKTFDKSMANLTKKIEDKREVVHDAEKELKSLKKAAKHGGSVKDKMNYDKKKKSVEKLKEQLGKLEISATDKEENKQVALGTSKLNYLDPRITVAWCKKYGIPVDKVYNKTQRQKFQWAIDMATADYNFLDHKNEKFKGKEEDEEEEEDE